MKQIILSAICLIFLVFNTSLTNAQTSSQEIIDKFFKLYEDETPAKAVDYAFSTNKWMYRKQDSMAQLKGQITGLVSMVGEYRGYELIAQKSIGKSYELQSYMVKYERQPIRFIFVLYKPNQNWQVQNFQYDDSLDDELEEAAKVYRLRAK